MENQQNINQNNMVSSFGEERHQKTFPEGHCAGSIQLLRKHVVKQRQGFHHKTRCLHIPCSVRKSESESDG